MALTFRKFPFPIVSVEPRVRASLQQLGESVPASAQLRLLGPIPVYAGNAFALAEGKARFASPLQSWRGLITIDGVPAASIELGGNSTKSNAPTVSVRGREAATAFSKVMEAGADVASKKRDSFEVRFLSIPRLFITALWLAGKTSFFIPTRIDASSRPQPRSYGLEDFRALVKRRLGEAVGEASDGHAVLSRSSKVASGNLPPTRAPQGAKKRASARPKKKTK